MLRISSLLITTTFLAIAFLTVPGQGWAGKLPEGVTIDVVAEYPTKVSGLEKILFRKLTIKPGASWTLTVPDQSVCQATKGEVQLVNQTSGKTVIFKVGDRWTTTPGDKVTLSNKGTEDHEHLFYTLVTKKWRRFVRSPLGRWGRASEIDARMSPYG